MDLAQIRKKIDDLDKKIVELLNSRTELAREVGKKKIESGKEIYAPERESEVYQKLDELNAKGVLPKDALKSIYREIMSAALALEKPLKIAYLGPEATFTHLAAVSKFGSSVEYLSCASISEIFREVEQGRADYGVTPIENSIDGGVSHTLDMFIDSDLKICSEIYSEIVQNLISNEKDFKNIKRVYSKSEALGQCRLWLEKNLHHAELLDASSTAAAAKRAADENASAAIGSKLAATFYNVPIVAESIQDFSNNVTRFLVIARQIPAKTKSDKTSILVSVRDKIGALYDMLLPIKESKVNMTKIESRPSKKKAWEYYFYIDLEGHIGDARISKTLKEMEKSVKFLKVLGSYPSIEKTKD